MVQQSDPTPIVGATYKHFKGGLYEVTGLARIETTSEPVVIYKPVGGDQLWVRPVKTFFKTWEGEVRFELVSDYP